MKLKYDGIEWGRGNYYYFYWWNSLKKKYRYFGPQDMWYDGPHRSFGFWYFNLTWNLPWPFTRMRKKFEDEFRDPWFSNDKVDKK